MTKHERTIIELAVRVLRAAVIAARNGCVDTVEVRLALRCLRGHCTDAALSDFYQWTRQLPSANRSENCAASLADILAALEANGAWPGDQAMQQRLMVEEIRRHRDERDRTNRSRREHYWHPPRRG